MSNGNFAGGMAAGYIIGSTTARESERSRQRRLKNMGDDQILLKVVKPKNYVGDTIANMYNKHYFDGNWIYKKHGFPFDLSIAIFVTVIVAIILFFIGLGYQILTDTFHSLISFGTGITISVILGILCGISAGYSDSIIDYIKIGTVGKYTTILIKKYDSDGNRNIDEDEIASIINLLEK